MYSRYEQNFTGSVYQKQKYASVLTKFFFCDFAADKFTTQETVFPVAKQFHELTHRHIIWCANVMVLQKLSHVHKHSYVCSFKNIVVSREDYLHLTYCRSAFNALKINTLELKMYITEYKLNERNSKQFTCYQT